MTVVAWPPPTPPNGRANSTPQVDAHPSDHNRIADALDTIIAQLDVTPWVAAAYGSGWSTFAGGAKAAYRRVNGMVQLQGLVTFAGTPPGGSTITTMPAGFRPAAVHRWGLGCNGGVAILEMGTTGALNWLGATSGATAGYLSIELAVPLVTP